VLGEAGADAADREHREAAVHEEDEVGGLLKELSWSFFFQFFLRVFEFFLLPSSLPLSLVFSPGKKNMDNGNLSPA